MNNTDAIEQAYRNGYEDGKRDAVKRGHWTVKTDFKIPLSHAYIRKEIIYICSYCNKAYRSKMNFCGNCGAKMDGEIHDNKDE